MNVWEMGNPDQQRALLRKYLLGELPETERSQLADRYFVDEELFDELLDVENELLDQYARKQLSPAEMTSVRDYLTGLPDGTAKLATAFALERAGIASPPVAVRALPGSRGLLQYASLVIILALLCGIAYLLISQRTLRHQIDQLRAEQERASAAQQARIAQENEATLRDRNAQLQQQLQDVQKEDRNGPTLATLLLTPVLRSGNTPDSLIVSSATRTILLVIPVANDEQIYSAVLQTTGGKQVLATQQLKPQTSSQGKTVSLRLPSRLLPDTNYKLTLQSTDHPELAQDFYFNVIRK